MFGVVCVRSKNLLVFESECVCENDVAHSALPGRSTRQMRLSASRQMIY